MSQPLASADDPRWSPPLRDPDDDTPRLECGVFGIYDVDEASGITALGLHALQHRGQEACGIAAFDGHRFHTERHMGHVADAFGGGDLSQRLPGRSAIGHTRYSTAGGSFLRNVQPMFADLEAGGIALAHNGNLTNFLTLREQLVAEGAIFQSTSDSEASTQASPSRPSTSGRMPSGSRAPIIFERVWQTRA
jgi:amidophosphoribosyltransferase